jgi:hypothetical protein
MGMGGSIPGHDAQGSDAQGSDAHNGDAHETAAAASPWWRRRAFVIVAACATVLAAAGVVYAVTTSGGGDKATAPPGSTAPPRKAAPRRTATPRSAPSSVAPHTTTTSPATPTTTAPSRTETLDGHTVILGPSVTGPTLPPGSPGAGKQAAPAGVAVTQNPGGCYFNADLDDYEDSGTLVNHTNQTLSLEVDVNYYDRTGSLLDNDFDNTNLSPGQSYQWSTETPSYDDPAGGQLVCRYSVSQ